MSKRTIQVDLNEIINAGGLEGFLELIESLFLTPDENTEGMLLSDIDYVVVGEKDGNVLIEVIAQVLTCDGKEEGAK